MPDDLPDLDALALRLVQLRHRERDLARRLEREEERHAAFASDFAARKIDTLRAELEPLRAEIAALDAKLGPLRRRPEQG
jgi:hypothetical protein